jgi:hypothetical protein
MLVGIAMTALQQFRTDKLYLPVELEDIILGAFIERALKPKFQPLSAFLIFHGGANYTPRGSTGGMMHFRAPFSRNSSGLELLRGSV